MAYQYKAPDGPPPGYPQQAHFDAGPVDPRGAQGYYGSPPPPNQFGPPGPYQQSYYGQPPPGGPYQQPMYYQADFKTGQQGLEYPEPLVVPPQSGHHLHSFIVLHGRGSNVLNFGSQLLATPIPGFGHLQDVYRDTRFIFPTASKRRANVLNRTSINQWFDCWSPQKPTENEELQFDGLRESSAFVHKLLEAEIAAVGADNVLLWGLSQGCAIALISLLLWNGPKLAGVVGMCGWLPLRLRTADIVREENLADDENPFASSDHGLCEPSINDESGIEDISTSNFNKAVRYLREELQVPSAIYTSMPLEISVFLGHGTGDEKVPVSLDKEAAGLLNLQNFHVQFKEYEGLAHWYSGPMLRDIVRFLQQETKIQPAVVEQVSKVLQANE